MRERRENESYLPGVALPETIELSDRWAEAAGASEVVVMAVPSRFRAGGDVAGRPGARRGRDAYQRDQGSRG